MIVSKKKYLKYLEPERFYNLIGVVKTEYPTIRTSILFTVFLYPKKGEKILIKMMRSFKLKPHLKYHV